MKTGSYLSKIFTKAGVDITNPALADVLSIQTEVPDEIATTTDAALLTLDAAKANPTLKQMFFAQALNGIDSEVLRLMTESQLEQPDIDELTLEKNSMKKVALLTAKIRAKESKAANATAGDKTKLAKEIEDLNLKIVTLTKDSADKLKEQEGKFRNDFVGLQVKSLLNGKKYANVNMPLDVNVETANVLLQRALTAADAKFSLDDKGQIVIRRASDETLEWVDATHQKKSPTDFIDSVLATNKLIEVTKTSTGNNGGLPNNGVITPATSTTGKSASFSDAIDNLSEEAMKQ